MFKKLATTALALACFACVNTVNADEPASSGISQSSLAAMGLSGLQTSDDSARAVRGQGYQVSTTSYAYTRAYPTFTRPLPRGNTATQGNRVTEGTIGGSITVGNVTAGGSLSGSLTERRNSRTFLFGFINGPTTTTGIRSTYAGAFVAGRR